MGVDNAGNSVDFSLAVVGEHSSTLDISTAKTITRPAGAKAILVQSQDRNARFTLDGSTPTATHGFQVVAGDSPLLIPVPGASIKVIQEAATAKFQYQWVA